MQLFVANNPLARHVTRETVALFGSGRFLGLLALIALTAGFSGPFGTIDALTAPERYGYWTAIIFGAAFAGQVSGSCLDHLIGRLSWPRIPGTMASACVTAVPVFLMIVLVMLAFGFRPDPTDLAALLFQCIAVVTGIAFLTGSPAAIRPRQEQGQPRLLDRIPTGKRGRLVRLRARDHYVEVVTTGGETLVAMRFRDAIAETAPEAGAQIHRSHWVALHAISGRCRHGDRSGVRLDDGTIVPLGRTFRTRLRKEGLL